MLFSHYQDFLSIPPNSAKVGTFCLMDNPVFCAVFLSFVAEKTHQFPTFEKWLAFLKADYKAPKKPDRDDPFLYKNPDYLGRNDLEAKTYRAYIFQKKMEQYQQYAHQAHTNEEKKRRIKARYSSDPKGYCDYLFNRLEDIDKQFLKRPQPFYIADTERQKHTYISGSTGSGKSEMMKSLIHYTIKNSPNTAVILIDPHGKIAQEVARFKENQTQNRLVLIDPHLYPDKTPVFNPFDFPSHSSPYSLDIAVQELVGAFREILQEVGFTPQMETLLKPCIATLLLHPQGSLYQLQQFMARSENSELIQYALEHLPNPAQKQFLKTDFLKTAYQPSRQSIRTKIQSLLNSQIFLQFTNGTSTFSLSECIAEKKLIVFNLSRNTGIETSNTIGRLILSHLQGLIMQRAQLTPQALQKTPEVHLFIDECQHYITPSIEAILTESRKYKLYLTLANQFLEQINHKKIRSAIKGNTTVKITGRQAEPDTLTALAKMTDADPDEIKNLKTGEYHIKAGTKESIKIQGQTNLLNNTNAMRFEAWEQLKSKQTVYYNSIEQCVFQGFSSQGKNKTKKRRLN